MNSEIITTLEQDAVRGMILVLEGMAQLAAVEGFDPLVTMLEDCIAFLNNEHQEAVSVGETGYQQPNL